MELNAIRTQSGPKETTARALPKGVLSGMRPRDARVYTHVVVDEREVDYAEDADPPRNPVFVFSA